MPLKVFDTALSSRHVGEDAEVWVKRQHAALISRHGDIPEISAIIEFLRKLELELASMDDDCRAYLRASETLYNHINTASV